MRFAEASCSIILTGHKLCFDFVADSGAGHHSHRIMPSVTFSSYNEVNGVECGRGKEEWGYFRE